MKMKSLSIDKMFIVERESEYDESDEDAEYEGSSSDESGNDTQDGILETNDNDVDNGMANNTSSEDEILSNEVDEEMQHDSSDNAVEDDENDHSDNEENDCSESELSEVDYDDLETQEEVPPSAQQTTETSGGGKHTVFDEDDDSYIVVPSASTHSTVKEESEEDSDSDAAPEVSNLREGTEKASLQDKKMMEESQRREMLKKEKWKKIHTRNKEQKEEKLSHQSALESCRLPEDLLSRVDMDKLRKRKEDNSNPQPKKTKFEEDLEALDESDEDDGAGNIPLNKGVQIKVLSNEVKKSHALATKASDFRHRMLYGNRTDRTSSWEQRQVKVKQQAGGKM